MKKVMILLTDYFPNVNAITLCMEKIIKELINEKYCVDVVCYRRSKEEVSYEEINENLMVYRTDFKGNKNLLLKKVMLKFLNWDNNRVIDFDAYKKTVKNILKNNKYDYVISTSFPFCLHELANTIKNKYGVKWIAFQFDPYAYNYIYNKKMIRLRENNELKTLKLADLVILPVENYNENINKNLVYLKDKYKIYYYSILNKIVEKKADNKKNKIIFCGYLYDKIREPFKAMEVLSKLNNDNEINFYYKSTNKMNDMIVEFNNKNNNRFFLYRNKSKKECDEAVLDADMLLNIGNSITNQTPSKIYEYISMGKPIINFYENDADTSYNVLKCYDMACNYNVNEDKIDKLTKFINNVDKNITYDKICKIYENECNSSKIIIEYIKEISK